MITEQNQVLEETTPDNIRVTLSVAVTSLPEPNRNHAVFMPRFTCVTIGISHS